MVEVVDVSGTGSLVLWGLHQVFADVEFVFRVVVQSTQGCLMGVLVALLSNSRRLGVRREGEGGSH